MNINYFAMEIKILTASVLNGIGVVGLSEITIGMNGNFLEDVGITKEAQNQKH